MIHPIQLKIFTCQYISELELLVKLLFRCLLKILSCFTDTQAGKVPQGSRDPCGSKNGIFIYTSKVLKHSSTCLKTENYKNVCFNIYMYIHIYML